MFVESPDKPNMITVDVDDDFLIALIKIENEHEKLKATKLTEKNIK